MKHKFIALTLLGTLCFPVQGKDEPGGESKSAQPIATSGQAAGHGHGSRGPARFMLANTEGASISFWKPDLTTTKLEPQHGTITLPRSGMEGFHTIVIKRNWGGSEEVLLRYLDLRGKPSGHSPRELLAVRKSHFEIVPDPLPREHRRYQSGETWGFVLRFDGQPVTDTAVTLTTAHGHTSKDISDIGGRVRLTLPDDFPDVKEGIKDDRSAPFQVSAEHHHQGMKFQTALDADYRINPRHWRSNGWGIAFAGFGLVAGGLLGRRVHQQGKTV